MSKRFFQSVLAGAALCAASCVNNPSSIDGGSNGSLDVRASLTKPQDQNVLAKSARTDATTWDSLVVSICASDMDTIVQAFRFTPSDSSCTVSLDNVPAGSHRSISVCTKTKGNMIIHVSASQSVDISSAEKKVLDYSLVPVRGSIYVDLTNIPTAVKHICASFGNDSVCEDRSTKIFMSLDNVPDKTSDSLVIQGADSLGMMIYHSSLWLMFSVLRDTTMSTQFCRISTNVSMTLTAQAPASTVVSGMVDAQKKVAYETGRLVVSEIMYNANDSEYVEVYNPSDSAYSDSLIMEIDGVCRGVGKVSIAGKGVFVVARRSLPWADAYFSSSSALDLSSNGNWISLRSKAAGDTVMDWVAFCGGSNAQEWPNIGSAKKSIVVDSPASDPRYNNYGRNWAIAQTAINQMYSSVSTGQYGTPKSKGL